ncbi:glycosyltransferase family 2 protein [Gloeocapsa sp. PCC 73106]|uniref:glycosyltransferase family 2 protein n=1 Tax=Gloeocapsa sp. PCC 73106 TaxID=102232 RepID=UPI0002AC1F7A|nr:glycosyltransferase family 2 protein [Gloeocapsa sp. PCC 73106]ELR96855.1 glycosyl transferase [Gloeocapsa sp. PCC 73106]
MLFLFKLLLWIPTAIICLNILVLLVECLSAPWFKLSQISENSTASSSVGILIPAHNEAECLGRTLSTLIPQVSNPKEILVIADNCTDQTEAIALANGVSVLTRTNTEKRGKGYALAYGLDHLHINPPDILIMVDADCLVADDAIRELTLKVMSTGRPVQALYLMEKPTDPSPKDVISAFAFLVKNWVRPLGLKVLGLPCLLTGTGMGFPWDVINQVSLDHGNIVEDMQLGIDLALAGYPPVFLPTAKVTGILPQKEQTAQKQRKRWEHGHLQTIITQVPSLLTGAIAQRSPDLLALALDLSVPPLSVLVMFWSLTLFIALIGGFALGVWLPALVLSVAGLLLLVAIITAWANFGKAETPLKTLLMIPVYMLSKLTIYLSFLSKRESQWVKTERD